MKRLSAILLCALAACSKPDPTATGDPNNPALQRPYCPVPTAVNYNWDFPGLPDSSVCYYPTDIFKGSYLYVDSFYREDLSLAGSDTFLLQFIARSQTKLEIKGFCDGPADSLLLTANRFLRAEVDSTTALGRFLCRPQDTISGFVSRTLADTSRVRVSFTVRSDTGVTLHYGTALRQ